MTKIVSQKRFVKGVNAATDVLSQQPGSLVRASNLLLTQRGGLQVIDGSGVIGTLASPINNPVAIGTFSNFVSGQYPYYPVLSSPNGYILPNITNVAATQTGGAANPPGTYVFSVVAVSGALHSDPKQSELVYTTLLGSGTITLTWSPDVLASSYSVYYLPGGYNATQGVLLSGAVTGTSFTFTGTLPVTPLTDLPIGNNSYYYQVQVGAVSPPSTVVGFSSVPTTFSSIPPQPAQIAPGDPNFTFQFSVSQINTYTGGSTSVSATQTNPGTTTQNSSAIASFPAVTIASGQVIAVALNLSYSYSGSIGTGSVSAQVIFQYSTDGGSTWLKLTSYSQMGSIISGSGSSINFNGTISGATTLSNVQFRVQSIAIVGGPFGGSCTASGTINSVSVTITNAYSFTPYGGVAGFASSTPQILQFAGKSILLLGNGTAPQTFDPSLLQSATITALGNTFQAAYPTWQSGVTWLEGNQLAVLSGGTNFLFTATQGGVSGTVAPTWNFSTGATTADGSVIWKCTGPIPANVAPRGAAHGVVYAGSLWLANTSPATTADNIDGPTCLKMSDSNNPNSWNPVNVAFIGRDDGTQITGLATFTIAAVGISPTGSMAVFKEFATYQIIGVFGSNNFEIQEAQTDMGCVAPRSIQFIPGFGVVRYTHLGFAVYDGVSDRLISEEIRPYLFGGIDNDADITPIDPLYWYLSQSAQSTKPPMYMCAMPLQGGTGTLTRVFCYDLILKAWIIIDLPWPIASMARVEVGEGIPLVLAGKTDGTIHRLQSGDTQWSVNGTPTAINWSLQTPDVYGEGSSQRIFYREIVIRGYATSGQSATITMTPVIDGAAQAPVALDIVPQAVGSSQFEARGTIWVSGQICHVVIAGTGQVIINSLDWQIEPKSTTARRIIG